MQCSEVSKPQLQLVSFLFAVLICMMLLPLSSVSSTLILCSTVSHPETHQRGAKHHLGVKLCADHALLLQGTRFTPHVHANGVPFSVHDTHIL